MTALRQQALVRARALIAVATGADAGDYSAKVMALRACHLLRSHGVLADVGERRALENAVAALVRLLECVVAGCEHTDRGVCESCARKARAAIVEARRAMQPMTEVTEGG